MTISCELSTGKLDEESATYTGLLLQVQNDSKKEVDGLWLHAKRSTIDFINEQGGFPTQFDLPCGSQFRLEDANDVLTLPIKDIPCPCNNPGHWLIRFVILE